MKTRENKQGHFFILNPPRPNRVYIAGKDPIPFGHSQDDEGSEDCMVIKDRDTDEYVAMYLERNMNADYVVGNGILLQEHYNNAVCMIEANRAEVTLRIYEDSQKMHLLANRPTHLGVEYEDKKIKKGWYNNDKTLARANKYLTDFLMKYGEKIRFERMIAELERYPNGNNDIVSAILGCELYDAELGAIEKRVLNRSITQRIVSYITRDSNGMTKRVFEKINSNIENYAYKY